MTVVDHATSAYGLPPPTEWSWVTAIPAPYYQRWFRVTLDPPRENEHTHKAIVQHHPWQATPPEVDSPGWGPLPSHGFEPRFGFRSQAIAWLMGLLYGAAWVSEFAPDKQP